MMSNIASKINTALLIINAPNSTYILPDFACAPLEAITKFQFPIS